MKTVISALALVVIAGGAEAQTTPPPPRANPPQAAPAADLTRDLNSGPPRPATYIAPAPTPAQTPPAAAPATTRPATPPAAAPRTMTPIPTNPAATRAPAPIGPANPAAPPRTAPLTPPAGTTAATSRPAPPAAPLAAAPATPPAAVAATPPAAAPAANTTLDAAARAALPFSVELPAGFTLTTGRPGPDFRIYTVRRGATSYVMIYAGPASQFPIYGGEMVEAGGRATVISNEGGQRHAMEHLFVRAAAPREIHAWTMTLEGADRALAEQIAQSVDAR